jgi:F-type H+-transporting ATPase subunit epsilon
MDNKTIQFEIVTPERQVLKEEVTQVTLPTREGEITVLPGHVPLVAILDSGVIEIVKKNGHHDILSLSGGFIEVLKRKVVILADVAERAEEIDVEKAREAREQAREDIKQIRHFDKERFATINAKIAKELARTKAAKRWRNIGK